MERYIWFILACFLAVGCSDENELKPSLADRDWFVIEDSEDPIGHERFLLYEKYGIPVFVNDTIGVEERGVDYYGNPVMYYCTLDINYTVGAPVTDNGLQSRKYSLLESSEDQLAGIFFLDNYLIPALPENMYFNSILLLDSLYEMRMTGWAVERKDINVYQGALTLAIGQVKSIAKMTPEEQNKHKGLILATLALKQLDEEQLSDFYMVSYDPVKKFSYYQQMVTPSPSAAMSSAKCEVYGFLDYDSRYYAMNEGKDPSQWIYYTLTRANDLEDFVLAYFQYSEKEFKELYADYPLVLEKYEIIKTLMTDFGYM
ncbi:MULTISPECIES: hypothetical protein [Butyricimonas]|uniref:hypothetical protein n=1 Tax=Butyricimonas TaxID=574697 RepID=UPI0022E49835|nr:MULTISPECIES: hypothetical protein [Butyricimonas]